MREVLFVGMGGFVGAATRYLLTSWIHSFPGRHGFPLGTLIVNVLGSFALGLLLNLGQSPGAAGGAVRHLVLIGMLGAFTTFSAFSLETIELLVAGNRALGVVNVVANIGLCLAGVALAQLLVSRLT